VENISIALVRSPKEKSYHVQNVSKLKLPYYRVHFSNHMTSQKIISTDEGIYFYEDGVLHNKSGPAVILKDGTLMYYEDGFLHNTKGPAYIRSDGSYACYLNGILCSPEKNPLKPTIFIKSRGAFWLQNNALHRSNHLPAAILIDGTKIYAHRGNRYLPPPRTKIIPT
jgi:hypothetical protein